MRLLNKAAFHYLLFFNKIMNPLSHHSQTNTTTIIPQQSTANNINQVDDTSTSAADLRALLGTHFDENHSLAENIIDAINNHYFPTANLIILKGIEFSVPDELPLNTLPNIQYQNCTLRKGTMLIANGSSVSAIGSSSIIYAQGAGTVAFATAPGATIFASDGAVAHAQTPLARISIGDDGTSITPAYTAQQIIQTITDTYNQNLGSIEGNIIQNSLNDFLNACIGGAINAENIPIYANQIFALIQSRSGALGGDNAEMVAYIVEQMNSAIAVSNTGTLNGDTISVIPVGTGTAIQRTRPTPVGTGTAIQQTRPTPEATSTQIQRGLVQEKLTMLITQWSTPAPDSNTQELTNFKEYFLEHSWATKEAQNDAANFAQKQLTLLDQMNQFPELREACFSLAAAGMADCHDNAVTMFHNMQEKALEIEMNQPNVQVSQLIQYGLALENQANLNQLIETTDFLHQGINSPEGIEAKLVLQLICHELNITLPIPVDCMHYPKLAILQFKTPAHDGMAASEIKQSIKDLITAHLPPHSIPDTQFLAKQPFWQRCINQNNPALQASVNYINQQAETEQEKLTDLILNASKTVPATELAALEIDISEKMQLIEQNRVKDIAKLYLDKTQELLNQQNH